MRDVGAPPLPSRIRPTLTALVITVASSLMLTGAVQLWQAHSLSQWQNSVLHELSNLRARLESEFYANMHLATRLAAFVSTRPQLSEADFATFAGELLASQQHVVRHFAYAPDHVIRYVYPLTGNQAALGLDLKNEPAFASSVALLNRTGGTVVSGPHALVQGGAALIVREPVFDEREAAVGGRLRGQVAMPMDLARYLQSAGVLTFSETFDVAIRTLDADGRSVRVFFGRPELFATNGVLLDVQLPGSRWEIAAQPHGGWGAVTPPARFVLPLMILVLTGVFYVSYRMIRQTQLLRESESRMQHVGAHLSALLGALPNLVSVIDGHGRHTGFFGSKDADAFPFRRNELLGLPLDAVLPPEKARKLLSTAAQALKHDSLQSVEFSLAPGDFKGVFGCNPEPGEQWFRSTVAPLRDNDDSATLWVTDNITASRRMEQALKRSDARFRQLTDALQQVVFETDREGLVTYVNPAWDGLPVGNASSPVGHNWLELLHPDDRPGLDERFHNLISGGPDKLQQDARLAGAGGGDPYWVTAHLVPMKDDAGLEISGALGTLLDINDRKRSETAIRHQALHDPLTDLPNRLLLIERLNHAINVQRRQQDGQLALLFVDLDNFKLVNDRHGHLAGDIVLREVGRRLESLVRETDTVARIGGDEFIVLIESVADPASIETVADKLVTSLAEPIEITIAGRKISCHVGASIGVAIAPRDGMEVDVLLRRADEGLYRAKADGKGVSRAPPDGATR